MTLWVLLSMEVCGRVPTCQPGQDSDSCHDGVFKQAEKSFGISIFTHNAQNYDKPYKVPATRANFGKVVSPASPIHLMCG